MPRPGNRAEAGRLDSARHTGSVPTDPFPLLGHRVVLRHQVGTQDGRPLFSDAVGELDREHGRWLIHTRRGPVIVHPRAVRAVREIPDAPPRRRPR